jgi:membrane-bound serine protease (ClpP class)
MRSLGPRQALPALLVALLASSMILAAAPPDAAAQSGGDGDVVVLVAIEGVVGPGIRMDVDRAVDEATERGVPLVVRLNTPGGLVSTTQKIIGRLMNAPIPTITYVGPQGASAFSAGTYTLLSGHVAAMNNGTSMGSAMPVQSGPGGTQKASNKTINALASYMRSIAEERNRPVDLAEDMVRNNTDYTAREALDANLVNLTVRNRAELLQDLDGRTVEVDGDTRTLDTADARVVEIQPNLASQIVRLVSSPQIAFLLLTVGFYGLIFGLAAGGTYVPETIGAILVLVGLLGIGTLDFSTGGVLLIALAGLFFAAEALTPTHGILSLAGAVSLALGGLLLLQEPLLPEPSFTAFRNVVLGTAAFSGLFVFAIVSYGLGSMRNLPVHRSVEGREGEAITALDPEGQVRVRGEVWRAVADGEDVDEGDPVEVVSRDGLTLTVRRNVGGREGDLDG